MVALAKIIASLEAKLRDEDALHHDYLELDNVGPAPGRPDLQHDTMVAKGLCPTAAKFPERNRYCNQFPFESCLVRVPGVEYINASWMTPVADSGRKYIITSGPMHPSSYSQGRTTDFGRAECPDTTVDLWRMIWETGARNVVMLCSVAPGFTGCSSYFPDREGEEVKIGDFAIRAEKVTTEEGLLIRDLLVRSAADGERTVKHFHFTGWPNYGVPKDAKPVGNFVRHIHSTMIKSENKKHNCDIVVHCSGGLGRSGTFLTAFSAFQALTEGKEVFSDGEADLVPIIKRMRGQRHPWMVEGTEQFKMGHKILVEALKGDI